MKKSLVQKYVAYKAAQIDFLLAEAKKVMKPEQYVKEVMSMKLDQIPVPLQRFLEKTISKRMGKEYTGSIYFVPTVGQWVDEMFGDFSREDILSYLSQASGLKPRKVKKYTIGDHVFDRPFLIELTEQLEKATGKHLIKGGDLAWLGEAYTYLEYANFFATV